MGHTNYVKREWNYKVSKLKIMFIALNSRCVESQWISE